MTGNWAAIFLLALTVCQCSFAKERVPVLIWNTNQAQGGVPAVSALQHINYGNFQAKYLASFKPNNILLFLQDALSVEDLTSHTTELQHIKHWMESGHSLFLPNVEDASHLVHDLPAHGYNVLKLDHDAGLNLKQDDKNLVVVELPSTLTNPSRRRALQKADEVMENVISKIGDQRDFTIIFTGRKPSVDERSDQYEERIRVARSLKAIEVDPPSGYYHKNCTKLYLRQSLMLNLYDKGGFVQDIELHDNFTIKGTTADCQPNSAKLVIKFQEIDIDDALYLKIILSFVFSKNRGSWKFDGIEVTSTPTAGSPEFHTNFTLRNEMDSVPVGMSFACSEKFFLDSNDLSIKTGKTTYTKAVIVLQRFQMEAFKQGARFDRAWDCVGFFTVPIWCGLLITILLVTILSIGLVMLSDIKTMDRFDDPKGQPIMVATAE